MLYTNPVYAGWTTRQGDRRGANQVARQFDFNMRQYDPSQDVAVRDDQRKAVAKQGKGQTQRPYTALSTISRECQQRLQQLQREIDEKNETIKRLNAKINHLGRIEAQHEDLKVQYSEQLNKQGNQIRKLVDEKTILEQELQPNPQLESDNSALQQQLNELIQERGNLENELSLLKQMSSEAIDKVNN